MRLKELVLAHPHKYFNKLKSTQCSVIITLLLLHQFNINRFEC